MDWSKMFNSRVIVFGCGNVLFGDDAIGPLIIEELEKDPDIPEDVALLDVGTAIRPLLFDLILSEKLPERVIIVDAITVSDKEPGEIMEIDVEQMDPKKIADFTMHQFPTSNLLKELNENSPIDLRLIVVQTGFIPDHMEEGLSDGVRKCIPELKKRVKSLF